MNNVLFFFPLISLVLVDMDVEVHKNVLKGKAKGLIVML